MPKKTHPLREVLRQRNTKLKMVSAFICSFITAAVLIGGEQGRGLWWFSSVPICFLLGVFDHRLIPQIYYGIAAGVGSIGSVPAMYGFSSLNAAVFSSQVFAIAVIPMTAFGVLAGVLGICAGGIMCKIFRGGRKDAGSQYY